MSSLSSRKNRDTKSEVHEGKTANNLPKKKSNTKQNKHKNTHKNIKIHIRVPVSFRKPSGINNKKEFTKIGYRIIKLLQTKEKILKAARGKDITCRGKTCSQLLLRNYNSELSETVAPPFLAPGTSFMEGSFSVGWGGGESV